MAEVTTMSGVIEKYVCHVIFENKVNLRDLIAASGLVISNWIQTVNFSARATLKFDEWPRQIWGHFFSIMSIFVHHFKSIGEFKLEFSYSPETPNLDKNRRFFEPHDLEIWQMTLKNNRSPLLYYITLCASFQSHGWNQTGVTSTVRKRSIRVKFGNFLSRMTLKFDAWPTKTIGHLS